MKFSPGYKAHIYHFFQMLFFASLFLILSVLWNWQPLNIQMVLSALASGIILMLFLRFRTEMMERKIEFAGNWEETLEYESYATSNGYKGKLMLSDERLQYKGFRSIKDMVKFDIPLVNIANFTFEKPISLSPAKNLLVIKTKGGRTFEFQLRLWHIKDWNQLLSLKGIDLAAT